MDKKVILSGIIVVVLLSLFYASYAPHSSFPTGLAVGGQSRYAQLKACVDGGQELNACRLAVGVLSEAGVGSDAGGGNQAGENCPSEEKLALIRKLWPAEQAKLAAEINKEFATRKFEGVYTGTYYLQGQVQSLFNMAVRCNEADILSKIYQLLLIPSQYLETTNSYYFLYPEIKVDGRMAPLKEPAQMWTYDWSSGSETVPYEPMLEVSQGVYILTQALRVAAEAKERTPEMRTHIDTYTNVIRDSFIRRWVLADDEDDILQFNRYGVFTRRGWSCNEGKFNHAKYIDHLLHRRFGTTQLEHKYNNDVSCNAVVDFDLWIIATVAEFLGANAADPVAVPLAEQDRRALVEYMATATDLLRDRLSQLQLTDFEGNPVIGLDFDRGMYADYKSESEFAYTGYEGAAFPTENNKNHPPGHGWDTSHGGPRFFQVYQSLLHNKQVYQQTFPDESILAGFARQFLYGTFNKNMDRPLFANFVDGTNGWYRVFLNERSGFPPWSGGRAVIRGGYGEFVQYEPKIGIVMERLWELMEPLILVKSSSPGMPLSIVRKDGGFEQITESVIGYRGRGIHIKNIDDKDELDDDLKSFLTPKGTAFSITGWFHPLSTQQTSGVTQLAGFKTLAILTRNGKFAIYEKPGGDRYEESNVEAYTKQEYRHVALTRETNGLTRLYVDGNLALEITTSAPVGGTFSVGAARRYWRYDGGIDEVRVYERTLTAEEIRTATTGTDATDGLIVHWAFENTIDRELVKHFHDNFGAQYVKGERVNEGNLDVTSSMILLQFLSTFVDGGASDG